MKIIDYWRVADPTELLRGAAWYPEARVHVGRIAGVGGWDVPTAASVVAALSPRCKWEVNIAAAESVARGERPRGILGRSYLNALAAAKGGRDTLRGPKVCDFADALMGQDVPVIDSWMLRAAGRGSEVSPREYVRVRAAYRGAATRLGVSACQFQATVWLVIRRLSRASYDGSWMLDGTEEATICIP